MHVNILSIHVDPANELSGSINLGYSARCVTYGITVGVWG